MYSTRIFSTGYEPGFALELTQKSLVQAGPTKLGLISQSGAIQTLSITTSKL